MHHGEHMYVVLMAAPDEAAVLQVIQRCARAGPPRARARPFPVVVSPVVLMALDAAPSPPRDHDTSGPPRDHGGSGPPQGRGSAGPPQKRQHDTSGPPRDRESSGPPQGRGSAGPPLELEASGPPREGEWGDMGPPRDGGRSGPLLKKEIAGPPRVVENPGPLRAPPREKEKVDRPLERESSAAGWLVRAQSMLAAKRFPKAATAVEVASLYPKPGSRIRSTRNPDRFYPKPGIPDH
ncbi:hypothetical protein T484DRAFT_1751922 [Baffinella frigidus]|nr:hypothetical protein T484DRAFT_1751922 [Cryptophyta sp. CCMP2293]